MSARSNLALVAITIAEHRRANVDAKHQGPGTRAAVSTLDHLARELARRVKQADPSFVTPVFLCACGVKPASVDETVRRLKGVPLSGYNAMKEQVLAEAREDGSEWVAQQAIATVDASSTGG
jgi:hypothetical protein